MNDFRASLRRRIDAAQGKLDCDLVIRGARWLDVFACEWRYGDLAILDGVIVGVDAPLKARREIQAKGRSIVPGFIDAHVHVESSLLVPSHFERAILPRGTTTAICDPHELANVEGTRGIQFFLDQADSLSMDLRVMLSSCVPATHLETNGGGALSAADLIPLRSHPRALGLAEMMNVPGVLSGSDDMVSKLEAFRGTPVDGHCPLVRGQALSAYAAAGISSCHESSEIEEAREKLTKGISVWIREGSVAKDLEALAPLLSLATSTSLGFCTDDRNPLDILTEGHIDHLVRETIKQTGVAPEVAYRASSWSVARHYGLDRGHDRVGAIAPGWRADLVVLEDAASVSIADVLCRGVLESELPRAALPSNRAGSRLRAQTPETTDLQGPEGQVHVIEVLPGKIITSRSVDRHDARGVARLSVLERHGHGSKPANAYVRGFGEGFRGAIASSVGHDSHNLIVVGSNTEDMQLALSSLIACGGGFAVAQGGEIRAELPLPLGGLMSLASPDELSSRLAVLKEASRAIGCSLAEPFLQLAFLSLPVIPSLKLTDRGLVDVERFEIIPVRAS